MTEKQIKRLKGLVKEAVKLRLNIVSDADLNRKLAEMSQRDVLEAFLSWEGIIGYVDAIESIFLE